MSSRPAIGRRTDSLFDNRYRIEQTYPRGQSGETVRAYDTSKGDQLVFIKRPALQDAPPMRTGQEQNILYEKRVLERLAGHAAIPELLQSSVFRVGGQAHQYIVIGGLPGESIESLVNERANRGEQLPELEVLVIFNALLEALQFAHDRKVVHNDLNPANVLWDREQYRLSLIGWGKAAILDGDNVPSGATKANDIFRVGELLQFVSPMGRLEGVISRAMHPDASQRFASAAAFRQALDTFRRPLEQQRTEALEQIHQGLATAENADQLEESGNELARIIASDPGYPGANALSAELKQRIAERTIQDNLHAVSVYMTSGNMARAITVLSDLKARMGEQPVLNYLLEVAGIMQADPILPPSAGFTQALESLLQGDPHTAGQVLIATPETRPAAKHQQYVLAERLTQHIPEVVLLRPHLVVLEGMVKNVEWREELRTIQNNLGQPTRGLQALCNLYGKVATILSSIANGSPTREIHGVLQRANEAVQYIVDDLTDVAQNALSKRERAAEALNRARTIDPVNPAFDAAQEMLSGFAAEIETLQNTTASGDGAQVIEFLNQAQAQLNLYADDITDPRFQAMLQGINTALAQWKQAGDSLALGGRRPAITAYQQAAEALKPFNTSVSRWFEDYARQIEQNPSIEQFSTNSTLGAALQEGWALWDKGRASEAQEAGQRALGLATSETEQLAARRLIEISEVLNTWLSNDGPLNPKRTEQVAAQVSKMFLPAEETILRTFTKQMPDAQIYLKAMNKGVVEPMREASAAAVRTLFLHYALHGMLALYRDDAEEAEFWREAAIKTLSSARTHPGYQALDAGLARRQLIIDAVASLNKVTHVNDLPAARQAVRAPLAAAQLEAAVQSMRAVDDALASWTDGDFRAVRQLLDTAHERATFAERTLNRDLTVFKGWLQDLTASAELLQQARHSIEQIALVPTNDPSPDVIEAHQKIIDITRRDLGESYTVNLRQWRDTYNSVRDLYLDNTLSREDKQNLIDGYLSSPTIEMQPALPIIRHWLNLINREPEAPVYTPLSRKVAALFTANVAPTIDKSFEQHGDDDDILPEAPHDAEVIPPERPSGRIVKPVSSSINTAAKPELAREAGVSPAMLVIGGVILTVILVALGLVFLFGGEEPPPVVITVSATPNGQAVVGATPTEFVAPVPVETNTDIPSPTPPTLPPTITRVVPTPTTDTATPTPTIALTEPTLAPGGTVSTSVSTIEPPTFVPTASGGAYDLLDGLTTLPNTEISWNRDWFGPVEDGWQLGTGLFKAGGAPLVVRLGPDVLTLLYGVDAAHKLTRVDATLELVEYEKTLLPTGNVYFGIGLESLTGPRAAVQGRLVQEKILDLGINQNGTFNRQTQIPVTSVKLVVSIERNANNTLTFFIDGEELGTSNASYAPGTPVNIYLYTSSTGVVVKVTALKIELE